MPGPGVQKIVKVSKVVQLSGCLKTRAPRTFGEANAVHLIYAEFRITQGLLDDFDDPGFVMPCCI